MERFGRYQVERMLASGGMGEVYLARQRGVAGFEKPVVIKVVLEHLAEEEEFVQLFVDEARLAARLNHPNIAEIFDLGLEDGRHFAVMEYVHGQNLQAMEGVCEKLGRPFPVQHAVRVILQVCEGLHYAHALKDAAGESLCIVHRDLCPQNIMVSYDGVAKIIDFGIAKARLHGHATEPGVVMGKYGYMSPEQCNGEELDARSDLFSLGVVLWELLTGRRLYAGATDILTQQKIVRADVPRPREVNQDIPSELEDITLRALRKSKEFRYQSALQIQEDLDAFLRLHGLTASSVYLESFMRELFGDAPEPVAPAAPVGAPASPAHATRQDIPAGPVTSRIKPAAQLRKCPKCMNEKLVEESVETYRVDVCPVCRGLFLDHGELTALLRRKLGERVDSHLFAPTPDILDAAPAYCAACGFEMEVIQGPFAVFYDQCGSCGGVFLDAGELASLQRLPDVLR